MSALEVVVVLGAAVVAGNVVAPRVRLARPVVLLVVGLLLGLAPVLREVHLPPQIMLLVFLPALLYWEALTSSLREIRFNLRGVVLLSTVLVALTAGAVAVVAHALGMPWGAAWVLGGALAPTDATAVSALSRVLPRRTLAVLQSETLVNDGTALVVYGVAVGVTVGEEQLTVPHVGLLLVVSYVGGVLAGALVAGLAIVMRRVVPDPTTDNVVTVLTPFVGYLAAESVGASGVLAVVVCGLVMTQVAPRLITAGTRRQSYAFWSVGTFVLNAALFVLVGMEVQSAVRSLDSTTVGTAVVVVLAVWATVLVVRFAFLVVSAYVIRAVDRRPSQRERRVTNRSRVVSTVAGARGAVSLAAALAVPTTVGSGDDFPARDLVVFVTAGVVTLSLLVQGSLLPAVVRWARFGPDTAGDDEMRLARRASSQEALDALDDLAAEVGAGDEAATRVRRALTEQLGLEESGTADAAERGARVGEEHLALRRRVLDHKRDTVLRLRRESRIDDSVLRRLQHRLDLEELRLAPEPQDAEA